VALKQILFQFLRECPIVLYYHSIDLYITYCTLPIQLLHNYQILIFFHKYVYNKDKLPSVFSNYFEENSLFHCYDTRQKDHFHIYSVLSDLGKSQLNIKI